MSDEINIKDVRIAENRVRLDSHIENHTHAHIGVHSVQDHTHPDNLKTSSFFQAIMVLFLIIMASFGFIWKELKSKKK